MTSLVIYGDTSGSIALAANSIAGTNTLTLPAETGKLLSNKTSGTVVQVVSSLLTQQNATTVTNSTSFVTANHSLTITPTSATNKILLMQMAPCYNSYSGWGSSFTIYRNGSNILTGSALQAMFESRNDNNSNGNLFTATMTWLDSPATTSAVTYAVYMASGNSANNLTYGALGQNVVGTGLSLIAMEIVA